MLPRNELLILKIFLRNNLRNTMYLIQSAVYGLTAHIQERWH